jgi:hypothetical protein
MFTKVLNSFTFLKLNKLSLESFLKFGGLITAAVVGFFFTGVINIIRKLSHQYRWKNSQNRIILASYNFCRSAIVIIFFALQFAGALAMLSLTLYWYMEGVFLCFTLLILAEICTCIYFGAIFILAFSFYFLLGLVFTNPDVVLLRLYYISLFIYGTLFTISFCTKAYFDLSHCDILGKIIYWLPKFMPTVHAAPPLNADDQFFRDLSELTKAYARPLFRSEQPSDEEFIAGRLKPVLQKVMPSLLLAYGGLVTPAVEEDLRNILTEYLSLLATHCGVWSLDTKYESLPGCTDNSFQQRLYIYKTACFKSYIDFFFKSPELFPTLSLTPSTNAAYAWYVNADYLEILNSVSQRRKYVPLIESNDPSHMQSLLDGVISENNIVILVLKNFFTQHSSAVISSSSSIRGEALNSHSLDLAGVFLNYNKINIYKPQLVVVSSAGPEGLVTVSPAGAAQIKVGTTAYEERLVKSWDNLADICDNLSYWDRFQSWLHPRVMSDEEYINSLRNTADPKLQKMLLAGAKYSPINPHTKAVSYLYPVKWHFVNEELLVRETVKVKFHDFSDAYEISKENSLKVNVDNLYKIIDVKLALSPKSAAYHLANRKRV